MLRKINLIDYIPDFLKIYRELNIIMDIESQEFNYFWNALKQLWQELFILTATEIGIKRFEELMNITPNKDATLEERRTLVLIKLNDNIPYTKNYLKMKLQEICGDNDFELIINEINLTLKCRIPLRIKHLINEVNELLYNVVPCNILIDSSPAYNTYRMLSPYKNKLLATKTNRQLREEPLDFYNTHRKLATYLHGQLENLTHNEIKEGY